MTVQGIRESIGWWDPVISTSFAAYGNKVHLTDDDVFTLCGRTIPYGKMVIERRAFAAPASGESNCQRCAKKAGA